MENYTLYMHVNKTNGKRYVGITSGPPSKRWKKGAGYYGQRRFYSAIKCYGWDGFEHIIVADHLSKEEAECREAELIKEYAANDTRYGYNIENGGVTHKISEEQKEHLRQVHLGQKLSEETKKKISESCKGLSTQWLTGLKQSPETIEKRMSKIRGEKNRRARAVCQYDLDGNFIAKYNCMQQAADAIGIKSAHISHCCRGDRPTAYGYIWKYAEEQ